jgi:hypothetical protein
MGLASGDVYCGKETLQFYFPLSERSVGQQLKSGGIPLWLPDFFGGYPTAVRFDIRPLADLPKRS